MNNYAIDELTVKLEMLKYYRGLVQGDKNIGSQRDKAIAELQSAIKQLSSTDKVIASGKVIMPFESEGFLVDGEFIGDIVREKLGDKSIENAEIIIREL